MILDKCIILFRFLQDKVHVHNVWIMYCMHIHTYTYMYMYTCIAMYAMYSVHVQYVMGVCVDGVL